MRHTRRMGMFEVGEWSVDRGGVGGKTDAGEGAATATLVGVS